MKKYCPECKKMTEKNELNLCKSCGKNSEEIDFIKTRDIEMDLLK